MSYFPALKDIAEAKLTLNAITGSTPLMQNMHLSEKLGANVLLKREDLQIVRSYKIRGAYNKIRSLTEKELRAGVVCASAGNHAQGVALSCQKLGIEGTIFMPTTTPKQKIEQVRMFGKENIGIVLTGDTFDASNDEAVAYAEREHKCFIPPFDDEKIIEGQATIGVEVMQDAPGHIDYIFLPIGGGGLAAGVGSYFKQMSPDTKVIGVEPAGAASMKASLEAGKILTLGDIDKFVDGAAVKRPGTLTFDICKKVLDDIVVVPEGKVCTTILELYNKSAIVVEPAGALSIAALDFYADRIKGKNIVCVVSGSNNDITRTEEIKERSLLYEGLKHYFVIRFPQRSGALLTFVQQVLGEHDDITHFTYSKKNNREQGPALIGIELQDKNDLQPLIERMKQHGFVYEYLNNSPDLFQFII
ncbi:MAG TPA: threonine ammonia-lyase [Candidatus Avirikenella pullistercoris]|nr:threonine ammonia-lyase [Candidatus Avirikenella pullistercoris]